MASVFTKKMARQPSDHLAKLGVPTAPGDVRPSAVAVMAHSRLTAGCLRS